MRSLFHHIPNALDDAAIASIMALAAGEAAQDGTIFSTAQNASTIRKSTIKWLTDEALTQQLFSFVTQANDASFGVEVTDHADIQFTRYDGAVGAQSQGHYDWHHDVHFASQDDLDRKISLSVQLSDEDDYEGGDLEFEEVITSANFRAKGTMVLFPSYLRHRITPVRRGTRYSLVAWFMGPRWR